jgi:nucleoside-diphosphate kinase
MPHHPKHERTLVIIKPDGVQRSLIGEIIGRFERVGLKFLALKMVIADEKKLMEHYFKEDDWFEGAGQRTIKALEEKGEPVKKSAIEYGKDVQKHLVDFLCSGPVVVMVLQGNEAVEIVRKIIGSTEPLKSDMGTIRGDYTMDSYELSNVDGRAVRNLIHASDSLAQAEKEIALWFAKDEVLKYNLVQEKILYDINLDGIKE